MGAHCEALGQGVVLVPLGPRYTQVGFNLISVQEYNGQKPSQAYQLANHKTLEIHTLYMFPLKHEGRDEDEECLFVREPLPVTMTSSINEN